MIPRPSASPPRPAAFLLASSLLVVLGACGPQPSTADSALEPAGPTSATPDRADAGVTVPEEQVDGGTSAPEGLDSGSVAASGDDAGVPTPPKVSFSAQVVPILQARCASCHGRRGGLTLTPAEVAYAGLVDVPSSGDASLMRVKPGAPLQSLLFLTLTDDAASAVGAMPPRQALSLAEPAAAELIRQWIAEGALKN